MFRIFNFEDSFHPFNIDRFPSLSFSLVLVVHTQMYRVVHLLRNVYISNKVNSFIVGLFRLTLMQL